MYCYSHLASILRHVEILLLNDGILDQDCLFVILTLCSLEGTLWKPGECRVLTFLATFALVGIFSFPSLCLHFFVEQLSPGSRRLRTSHPK